MDRAAFFNTVRNAPLMEYWQKSGEGWMSF